MKPNQTLLQFMLRAQQIARQDGAMSNKGYAMLMTSTVAIMMFSLIGAYLTMTNMSKSATAAYADSSNTFYAAESGLNDRAARILARFNSNNVPTGMSPGQTNRSGIPSAADMRNCITPGAELIGSADFICTPYNYEHNSGEIVIQRNDLSKDKIGSDLGGSMNAISRDKTDNYTAYTFVADTSDYDRNAAGIIDPTIPLKPLIIPANETYGGLRAEEYKYTVYSTAAKVDPANPTQPTIAGGAQTVLEMNFRNRLIPLFQFAAFYENDLELDPSEAMTITGPVHTNSNLMAIALSGFKSAGTKNSADFDSDDIAQGTRILGRVTAGKEIFDRVPATSIEGVAAVGGQQWRPPACSDATTQTGAKNQSGNCGVMAVYIGANATPSGTPKPTEYAYFPNFVKNSSSPRRPTPLPAPADLTIPTVPKNLLDPLTTEELKPFGTRMRTGVTRLSPPQPGFLRERNYQTGAVGEYYAKADMRLKMFPGRLFDPAGNLQPNSEQYIPFSFTSIQSGSPQGITKGQLRSLMQPVLQLGTPPSAGSVNEKVIRALQSAIAASPTTVKLLDTTTPVNQTTILNPTPTVAAPTITVAADLTTGWRNTFINLLRTIPAYDDTNSTARNALLTQTPGQIVNNFSSGSRFLSAPIQVVNSIPANDAAITTLPFTTAASQATTSRNRTTARRNFNPNVGFFDNIKGRQIQMLQTNINSLTVWNANGVYVSATNEDLNQPYVAGTLPALSAALPSTRDLAFVRAPAKADPAAGTFANAGQAAAGNPDHNNGLVFYASVSDDLRGDGTSMVTASSANPIPGKDPNGNPIPSVDYYRTYPGTGTANSPYGFAFTDGTELPGPLTIATDQAAYIQGDYNNPNPTVGTRQPAAIMADTVTVLSNNCISNINKQINCGFSRNSNFTLASATTINAALLSNVKLSTPNAYNGGLNRFMRTAEDWRFAGIPPVALNYTGSFVSLGTPLEVQEANLTVPQAPTRDFKYDTKFDTFTNLPPLTPKASYLRQDVFKRSYN